MFFTLGLKNAWRNRARTLLGILSMAIAAVIFTSTSSLSQGYPKMAYMEARALVGGDIVLIPGKSVVTREDMASEESAWGFGIRSLDRPTPEMGFDAGPYSFGHLEYKGNDRVRVTPELIQSTVESLKNEDSISQVSVRRLLPCLIRVPDTQGESYAYAMIEERQVSFEGDADGLAQSIAAGRYFLPTDGDDLVGIGCRGWAGMTVPVGSTLPVEIPRAIYEPDRDSVGYDYENPVHLSLEMIGAASFSEGQERGAIRYANPTIFVTPQAFARISSLAGFGPTDTVWGLSVKVKSMAVVENVASMLRIRNPGFTVLSVPQMAAIKARGTSGSRGVPLDMSKVTEMLSFLTAALISATNLSVLMLARKNEIGILRSIGATGLNIAVMVLTESIWIAALGAVAGYLVTQPALIWTLVSNQTATGSVARTVASGLGRTLVFAILSAGTFGLLPVAKALKITPAQVLRGE